MKSLFLTSLKMEILFICEYNACRSQMAEGIALHIFPETVSVRSAGLYPGEVHIWTIEAMGEIGIDISAHQSKQLESVCGKTYDYVIILAEPAMEATRVIQAKNRLPWFHPDPAKETGSVETVKAEIRRVRDALKAQIEAFAISL